MTLGDILASECDITRAVKKIAAEIVQDYGSSYPLFVGVMDGAVCFLADLIRAFPDTVGVATARVRSYSGAAPGTIRVEWLPPQDVVADRHVLIVEGIVDTGATVAQLAASLQALGAASVRVCALMDKPSGRTNHVRVAYAGFDVSDVFVVGYGLDYDGAYRNLRDMRELMVG